jgi:pSer/pThr/pTyr-binding forkhead associated (FHA) protein
LEKGNLGNFERFCPICKNKNEGDVVVCRYCGASLVEYPTRAAATTKNTNNNTNVSVKIGEIPLEALTPSAGIAIYISGTARPVFTCSERELVIGRKADEEEASESLLDLSEYDGFKMGISRRHATIRQIQAGYEVVDLASTNGTWLNDKRLIPHRSYPFESGSQLRIGRMRFLVLYHSTPEPGRKN